MVQDQEIIRAVSRILQRAERQDSIEKMVGTFVDVGFLPQLHNDNNQLFYGRRGTGKTHVLKVLDAHLKEGDDKNIVAYIDCRTLGSSAQFSDATVPLQQRCTALFRDILGEVHSVLLERIFSEDHWDSSLNPQEALNSLDELSEAITQPVEAYVPDSYSKTTEAGSSSGANAGVEAAATRGVRIQAGLTANESTREEGVESGRIDTEDKVLFPSLHRHLSNTLQFANARLYILLDEWSSLPTDIQPYLAEFLKRSVLPVQRAVYLSNVLL